MIFFVILLIFSFPQQDKIIGNWEQTEISKDGIRETLHIEHDKITFYQEFFSKDTYSIKDGVIKILNDSSEIIIQSKIKITQDTLKLISMDDKLTDKMFKISGKDKNEMLGSWKGKTNKGVNTYFTFNEDKTVTYRALLDIKSYKYKTTGDELIIYTPNSERKLNYQINKNLLTLVYKDTNEKFYYKKTNELLY